MLETNKPVFNFNMNDSSNNYNSGMHNHQKQPTQWIPPSNGLITNTGHMMNPNMNNGIGRINVLGN